jgi:predicted class III extradiol MEMO1 family dioxygenase
MSVLIKSPYLLVDFNNIMYAVFFADIKKNGIDGNEKLLRHLFLNKLLYIKKRTETFSRKIILCVDHKINWRKNIFQYYKKNREKMREESDIDFKKLFVVMNEFYFELVTYFPFCTLRNQYIEADDWIAVLTKHFSEESIAENVIIVSTDRDFYQLQQYKNVLYQFDHRECSNIKIENPKNQLKAKVLLGDRGDGIPNVFSDDDTFVIEEKRQIRFGEKKAWQHVIDNDIENFIQENKLEKNYQRNQRLINFDYIPDQIKEVILKKYVSYNYMRNKTQLEAYFNSRDMNAMRNRIGEFFV